MTNATVKFFLPREIHGFTVFATVKDECRVEFVAYDIFGRNPDGTPLWANDCQPVDTVEEAEVYFSGQVKWDHCSNWQFDEQERVMLHFCCRDELLRLGEALAGCWDWAKELLGTKWANYE